MCTAPQGTRTAKSMLINDRMQNPVFSKTVDGSEHSESKFCYSSELSDAELLRSPTRSESTERKSTLLTNEEVHNFLMIRNQQQANRRSSKTTFPDELSNNYITFGISKQTLQAKLLSVWKHQEFIVGEKQENYLKKTKYDKIVSSSFLWVSRVSERSRVKPERSQTYLVYSMINCSAVSLLVLFEETKLSTITSSLPCNSSR